MCTYIYIHLVIGFFPFFVPLGLLGLIIVRHFPKKGSNAAILRSGKNTASNSLYSYLCFCHWAALIKNQGKQTCFNSL